MSVPRRVKVQGDFFHGKIPDGAIYVGRAAPGLRGTEYANPYPVKHWGVKVALQMYIEYLLTTPGLAEAARRDLSRPRPGVLVPAGRRRR